MDKYLRDAFDHVNKLEQEGSTNWPYLYGYLYAAVQDYLTTVEGTDDAVQ